MKASRIGVETPIGKALKGRWKDFGRTLQGLQSFQPRSNCAPIAF